VNFQHARWEACAADAAAALDLARSATDARAQLFARVWAARSAMVLGDAGAARAHVDGSVALAEQLQVPFWLNGTHLDATWLAALEGRWEDARREGDLALAAERADTRALACRAAVEYQTGERAAGDAFLRRLIDAQLATTAEEQAVAHNVVAAFVPLLSRMAGLGDEHATVAREAAAQALAAHRLHPLSAIMVHAGLAQLAAAELDAGGAAEHYEALSDQTETALLVATIAADRLLGRLAAVAGDADGAARHFERALAFCDAAGYRPEWAWSAHDYVLQLAPEHGGALVDRARRVTGELGMAALAEQLDALV
jgi:hypothetical protein